MQKHTSLNGASYSRYYKNKQKEGVKNVYTDAERAQYTSLNRKASYQNSASTLTILFQPDSHGRLANSKFRTDLEGHTLNTIITSKDGEIVSWGRVITDKHLQFSEM